MTHYIYIPSGTERLEYVIVHERTHIRRIDHISKLFAYALLSINWFDPVNWLMFRLFSDDIELACDECVTASLNSEARKEYMSALLDAATGKNGVKIPYHVCFSESITKRRIKAMLKVKKLSTSAAAAAVICCVIAGAAFGTGAVTAKQPSASEQYSAEPSIMPMPTDAGTVRTAQPTLRPETDNAMPTILPEFDEDKFNSADTSITMPAAPYTAPISDNANMPADMETESDVVVTEDNGGGTIPEMRMPGITEDMPEPAEHGAVKIESETADVYEPENAEPDHAEYDNGTTGIYTSDSVSRGDVTGIEMGASREDVYSALGISDGSRSNSAREEYSLDDGGTAVLIFDENDQLERGYIAENNE